MTVQILTLRVVFESASIARDVIASAKYLRRSADEYVRGNVFINTDLTRAEAEAAYHARCERRRLQQLKSKPTSATTESPAQQTSKSKAKERRKSPNLLKNGVSVIPCLYNLPLGRGQATGVRRLAASTTSACILKFKKAYVAFTSCRRLV